MKIKTYSEGSYVPFSHVEDGTMSHLERRYHEDTADEIYVLYLKGEHYPITLTIDYLNVVPTITESKDIFKFMMLFQINTGSQRLTFNDIIKQSKKILENTILMVPSKMKDYFPEYFI